MAFRFPPPKVLLMLSAVAAIITIGLKMMAWYLTGSVGFLSDGLESFVNLAGAVFALAMVTVAEQPPDEMHPFGHDKAEYFSSGFEGILIFGAAAAILWAAVDRLFHPQELEQLSWGMALSVASTVLNAIGAWVLIKAGRHHRSPALEADGRHLRTAVWTSIGVIVGVALVHLTGWLWLDPVVAIVVALNIMREGWHLIRVSGNGLMDTALKPEEQAQIQQILDDYVNRERDAQGRELLRFDHVATRAAGQRNFVSMHMHMPSNWSIGKSAKLRNDLEHALMQAQPHLHATIEMLPFDVEPHQSLFDAAETDAAAAVPEPTASTTA